MPSKKRLDDKRQRKVQEEKMLSVLPERLHSIYQWILKHGAGPTILKWARQRPEGLFCVDVGGEPYLHDNHGKGTERANAKKKSDSEEDAQEMRERYREKWGKHEFTQEIAELECVSVRTVQRYIKKFPP